MVWEFTYYSILLLLTGCTSAGMALLLWQKRSQRRAQLLGLAMLAQAEWSFMAGLAASSILLEQRLVFTKLSYVGVYLCIPMFFFFVLNFSGFDKYLNRRIVPWFFVIPVVMIGLAATNEYHHLIWTGFVRSENVDLNLIIYLRGPLYWLGVAYIYSALCVMTVLLVQKARQKTSMEDRHRSMNVLLSVLPPWLANFIYIAMFQAMQGLDFTPAAFSLSGILMYLGVTRLHILDLSPTVRDVLFERMRDAIIIIDRQNILVDANRAAETLLGMERKRMVGRRVERILNEFSGVVEQLAVGQTQTLETAYKNEAECSYEVAFIPLLDEQNQPQGQMISFRDIRQRKHAEAVERENYRMAEALQDVTIALTNTLDFDEVLDRILENIYHVLPCLMANIMLVDEHNVCKVERLKGYLDPGLEEWIKTVRFNVNEAPNLVWMAESGEPMVIPDVLAVPYWKHENPLMRAYLGAPIKIKDRLLGFINLDHSQPGFYTTAHTNRLKVFADLAAVAIENARMFKITQEMAVTDSLTGLNNRRHLFTLAEKEVHRALRYNKNLCVLMMDMDNFKDINDTFGHQMGDVALRRIADILRNHLRDIDVVGRYGGDEFCILLPETGGHEGRLTAERLLIELMAISIETASGQLSLRASVGVAELRYNDRSFEDILFRADQALYQAKSGGRGRVTLISAPEAASTEPPAA